MSDWSLAVPATLDLDARERVALGLPPGPLNLRRAWPRRDVGTLALEYATADGSTIAGQWFADQERLDVAATETARASQAPSAIVPGTHVFLQARGADRRLRAIAPVAARDGAALMVHRPERSAVVRVDASNGTCYVKVTRRSRVKAIAAKGRAAQRLAGPFITPQLLEFDVASGVIVWSGLVGVSLYDLFGTNRLASGMRAVGEALKALHGTKPPDGLWMCSALDAIGGLEAGLERLKAFVPNLHSRLSLVAPSVYSALLAASSPPVLLHGDFSGKQVVIDDAGHVGIVDFDTFSTGEAALDVANAIVKLEVRAIQGLCTPEQADQGIEGFSAGYEPSREVLSRMNAYADVARLHLACFYAFRPAWAKQVPALLIDRIGVECGDCSTILPARAGASDA